jgi:hypothetical protein
MKFIYRFFLVLIAFKLYLKERIKGIPNSANPLKYIHSMIAKYIKKWNESVFSIYGK